MADAISHCTRAYYRNSFDHINKSLAVKIVQKKSVVSGMPLAIINCIEKLRRYVKKGSKRVGGRGIYIINLVIRLIDIYHILLQF